MKRYLSILLIAAGLVVISQGQTHHQPPTEPRRAEAVFLWAYQTGYNISDGATSQHYYDGAKVYVSSSSQGAPSFPQSPATNLVEIAEATAQLLSLGYSIKTSDNGLQVIATKP